MGAASGGGGGGSGRASRALRLLLLLVLTLAAVEYLSGTILDSSPIRTYIYTPIYNATLPARSIKILGPWPKIRQTTTDWTQTKPQNTTAKAIVYTTAAHRNSTAASAAAAVTIVNSTKHNSSEETPLMITKLSASEKSSSSTEFGDIIKNDTIPLCDNMPPDLGPVSANKSKMELAKVDEKYPDVQIGGIYSPPNCTARHKVAIIVPFRDRDEHLAIFLNHMHPFLMKQQIEYGIYIIEQKGSRSFNRAKLMNVGFKESQRLREGGWQCFVFHDIDLLPLDERNMYTCPRQPRHMSASIDKLHFKLPYEEIFGGVSAMTLEQFTKVNGFSNNYWGWGGEDDDMYYRLHKMKYHLSRYKMSIARYAMLNHRKSTPNPKRYQLLSQTTKTFQKDGLTSLKYEVVKVTQFHLYTHVLANIDVSS